MNDNSISKPQRQIPLNTAVILFALVIIISGGAGIAIGQHRSDTVATVNGEAITQRDLYNDMYNKMGLNSLEQIIARTLVMQEAKSKGVSISSDDLQSDIQEMIEEQYGSEDVFNATLQYYGMTREAFEDEWKTYLTAKTILLPTVSVSEEELQAFFRENQDQFNIKESVKMRQIVTATKEEADDILDQLRNGKDFAALAKEQSIDSYSRSSGGELGWVERGTLTANLEDAIFALPIDEFGGPIETSAGFLVFQVTHHQEARDVDFSEVRETVSSMVKDRKVQELIPTWMSELRSKANIEYR